MNDQIPIGTPPAPPGRHAAPSGWYPDPSQAGQERYWDGWQWSRDTRAGSPAAAPGGPPAGYPPQPYPPQPQPSYGRPQPMGGPATGQQRFTADGVPLAGWWWRVLSVLIDFVVLRAAALVLAFPFVRRIYDAFIVYYQQALQAAQRGDTSVRMFDAAPVVSDVLAFTGIYVVVALLYFILVWRFRGSSLGQLAAGLRVVPVDQGRSVVRLAWSQVVIRAALWVLPASYSLLRLFQLVDVLFPLWHPKRQALHDLVARTQVVRTR